MLCFFLLNPNFPVDEITMNQSHIYISSSRRHWLVHGFAFKQGSYFCFCYKRNQKRRQKFLIPLIIFPGTRVFGVFNVDIFGILNFFFQISEFLSRRNWIFLPFTGKKVTLYRIGILKDQRHPSMYVLMIKNWTPSATTADHCYWSVAPFITL